MGRARLIVTGPLLLDWMPLPAGSYIVGSVQSEREDEIEIIVESPELPANEDNADLPRVTPTFRRNVPIEFVNWGLRK